MTRSSATVTADPVRSAKGEQTRARIHECALELFALHGYEGTTMRMVAERAGVNVALSYRYFPSKEHLVLEFYREFTRDFIARCAPVLAEETRLAARLTGVAEAMFDAAAPHRGFAASLFTTAASPSSPLNPLSGEFGSIRRDGIELFQRVIDGCRPRVPDDSANELAFLLWTFNLGLMYSWIHDGSENQQTTRSVLRQSTQLIVGLVRLSSLPGARHFRRQLVVLTQLVRSQLPGEVA